jgi:zinc transporter ZupT
LGGALAFFIKKKMENGLKYILAFSGAFLLATSVMHIIPEVYASQNNKIGVFVLLGFLVQLFLEYFSQGIEHGHIHVHGNAKNSFPIVIMLSLCIHSLLEGLPLVREISGEMHQHSVHSHHSDHSLLLGIILHKFPISIALMSMFLKTNLNIKKAFFWLFVFAIMAPLGTLIGYYFKDSLNEYVAFFDYSLAIVLGMFLHISTTILFESDESHKFNFIKLIIIITGGVLAYFTS